MARIRLLVLILVAVSALLAASVASADSLLLWNRFESEENVTVSDFGPGFQLTSYIYDDWQEARIEPAMFGNGLYVNHDIGEGWHNDGANFFALDLWDTGVTPERGTIEFWFKFKYDCSIWNHAYFFHAMNELTGHLAGPASAEHVWFSAVWEGWNLTARNRYWFFVSPGYANTAADSAGPGGPLAFAVDSLHHFAFVWDAQGIDGTDDTMRIYVNGSLEGASADTWDDTDAFRRHLYLGTAPNQNPWDTNYNAVQGVTDNLKIWDYAKTDFSDRFVEGVGIEVPVDVKPGSCPNPLNVRSHGRLPVAIVGTEEFDVTTVDPLTIRLEGVAPVRSSLSDVAAPYEPYTGREGCLDCTHAGPDGRLDLMLHFRTHEIVEALGAIDDRECRVVHLVGSLREEAGGMPFAGEDVLRILSRSRRGHATPLRDRSEPEDAAEDAVVDLGR